jgi:beta-galactosidase
LIFFVDAIPSPRLKFNVAQLLLLVWLAVSARAKEFPLNDEWRFLCQDAHQAATLEFQDEGWQTVSLPHTAQLMPLAAGHPARQWQGICWYRKQIPLPSAAAGKDVFLRFDGAMNAAEIWVNGQSAGAFMGGYLPYVMDITRLVHPGVTNVIAVRLDNRDNPITGPKPLADLDFNLYGGLYRGVSLIIQDRLHITDPSLAGEPAGGGVFVTFPLVSANRAVVQVKTQIKNDDAGPRSFSVRTTLRDTSGKSIMAAELPAVLTAGATRECLQELSVEQPKLWSPKAPNLYVVQSELVAGNDVVDATQTRVGIRRLAINREGCFLNGSKMFLRGCNRHQEYPFVGNALSDAAQYRDALKIKEAGFDYVRLSHYPQSPAFLAACDELGLIVMDSILGWQYFNPAPAFAAQKYQECRQLIRRDRNHPCVMLWEVSLNESDMPAAFIQSANAIAHEEYPGDQCFTAGWERGYDVLLQARQHGGCRDITDVPCLVSEYGDWEYYAQNAGLNQGAWKNLQPAERSSRQVRGDGEVRLLQQALNFQEAHNDNLQTRAFGDGVWVMFDYSRGYAPDLETSGVMDVFRLPKFSYWFFRSQRDADELVAGRAIGPVVYIANNWCSNSPTEVRVFSNCEEIALYLNGRLMQRNRPAISRMATHLKHPPFIFKLPQFEAGTLRAVGWMGGQEVATMERQTPGEVSELTMQFDLAGQAFAAAGKDVAFCRANLTDANGTATPLNGMRVGFGSTGGLKLVETETALTEAGTATVLVEGEQAKANGAVYGLCLAKVAGKTRILSAAATPDGKGPAVGQTHYTTDGSEPTLDSPVYSVPIDDPPTLRAAIFVAGRAVASTRP